MAKRARGTRPGQRAPLQRRGPVTPRLSSPVNPPPPTFGLTPAEEARAAELEAAIVATERTSARATTVPSDRPAMRAIEPRVRTGSGSIAARAAEEYGYVSRDVRRIIMVGGSLLILLIALWAVTQATGTRLY